MKAPGEFSGFRHAALNERTLGGRYRALPEFPLDIPSLLSQVRDADAAAGLAAFTKLFCCYRPLSSSGLLCLEILREAALKGHLDLSSEFISVPPDTDSFLKDVGRERGRVAESAEHQGMKMWVRKFLRGKGVPVPDDEISMLGYRVDVGCPAAGVFVECGDTEPRKVFEFLREILAVGLFPYNAEEIAWLTPGTSFPGFAARKAKGFLP